MKSPSAACDRRSDGRHRLRSGTRRAAIDEPKHEHHAKLSDWIEDDFDPKVVDTDGLAEAVNALVKRWSREACGQTWARYLTRGAGLRVTLHVINDWLKAPPQSSSGFKSGKTISDKPAKGCGMSAQRYLKFCADISASLSNGRELVLKKLNCNRAMDKQALWSHRAKLSIRPISTSTATEPGRCSHASTIMCGIICGSW